MKPLLTIQRAAEILGIPISQAYTLARRGVIPVVRVGRQIRVDPDRLQEWIHSGGQAG